MLWYNHYDIRAAGAVRLQEHTGLKGKEQYICDLFTIICQDYDAMNQWMSLGLLRRWQEAMVMSLRLGPGDRALDVCSGTGEVALAMARAGVVVTGLDFCQAMLDQAAQKSRSLGLDVDWVPGNALELPFADEAFAGTALGFSLRNLTDLTRCFGEMARVTRTGGRVAVMELAWPRNPVVRAGFGLYVQKLIPAAAAWLSPHARRDAEAYQRLQPFRYLPSSIRALPDEDEVIKKMESAGLQEVRARRMALGAVCLYTATR
ncbi:MAG: ubiquinone/menaquinone biosynthesis methyltransferase [Bacillota bacterium]